MYSNQQNTSNILCTVTTKSFCVQKMWCITSKCCNPILDSGPVGGVTKGPLNVVKAHGVTEKIVNVVGKIPHSVILETSSNSFFDINNLLPEDMLGFNPERTNFTALLNSEPGNE